MQEIRVELTKNPKEKPHADKLPFGKIFTDHMFVMDYEEGKGWFDPRIVPYGPFELDPCSMVFHYAQEIFEGMKAYRRENGEIVMFRPDCNYNRLNDSADRLCCPRVDVDFCIEATKKLVALEREWVPYQKDATLYIRPFIIATDQFIGVHTSSHYIFCVILSPSGSYYAAGINPVRIMVEDEDVRAVRGGTGFTKCGGNYAASIRAGEKATQKGFAQVLWLDGVERKYIEEVGSMNIMFKISGKLVTPALDGSILPGVTRRSIIQLAKDWGMEVEEREISIDELISRVKDGSLEEMFGTGTAAVVSPVGEISYLGESYVINGGKIGSLVSKLYAALTDIQWGRAPDTHGWMVKVC